MIDVSPFLSSLSSQTVLVFGLGKSGMASAAALRAAGADVITSDDNPDNMRRAADEGFITKTADSIDFAMLGAVVLAPGVPLTHPAPHSVVLKAQEAGITPVCDIEILYRCHPAATVIAVTGTNGKSTTTALIGHILSAAGHQVAVGGNIGAPALGLEMPPENGFIVLELSSFQIDLCPSFAPDMAVLLNITPDHLDRHGTLENYAAIKERLCQRAKHTIIATDDDLTKVIADRLQSDERVITRVSYKDAEKLSETKFTAPTLPGDHNAQNIVAVWTVCRDCGLPEAQILEGITTYPGLPHRQELIRVINGIPYINDSKATNGEATEKALTCYRNIHWILGGKEKDGGLKGLENLMERVAHAYLIGSAADSFAKWLERNRVDYTKCGTMDAAVALAHAQAQDRRGQPGGAAVVLLSPACASYDQYKSFEHRGADFRALVEGLSEHD